MNILIIVKKKKKKKKKKEIKIINKKNFKSVKLNYLRTKN